ncbi:helix-turn-helix domain-containing protein [Flavobacterium sp. I3-2]|uniref:helix-turn-helix domain-containing protein n=1 Tax=Flavobacterium sp. I3-2 TaxID=2748319 RepID=UPI0015AEF5A7|nr:AraC family transcriptional regulator [Flavobacterium sp. I3-2]
MNELLSLSNPRGYISSKATYLTENDQHITQYNDVYQILWVKKGTVKISLSHLSKVLEPNDCIFLGKNEMFRLTASESYELHYIQFTEDFYCINESDRIFLSRCSYFNNTESINFLKLEPQYIKFVENYAGMLNKFLTEPFSEINNLLAKNTIERILLFTLSMDLQHFQSFNSKKFLPYQIKLINKFNELIKNNIKRERSVAFYANSLDLDTNKMKEMCKSVYGITPKKFIAIACINEAKTLLKHTNMSIKEISYELNFEDVSNFIRFFITATSISPSKYRESLTSNELKSI